MVCLGLGLIPAIIAVVLGNKGRKEVATNPTNYQGGGMATAGFVMGIIGIILNVLMLLFWIVYIIIIAAIVNHMGGYPKFFDW